MGKKLKTIGRLEKVDLPALSVSEIDAKIDTGAYTSSLHCHHIEIAGEKDQQMVHFNLFDPSHSIYPEKLFKHPLHRIKMVKSSNGSTEKRYIILTQIALMDELFDIEFSLTDRSAMKRPILIGRRFLQGKFLVDVSKKYSSMK